MENPNREATSKMYQEILEQPAIIRDILNEYINIKTGEVEFKEFKGRVNALKNMDRITLLGCGSSYFVAEIGNYILEEFSGLPCEFEMADEFVVRKKVVENKTAIIVLSQSGETGDILKAVKQLKERNLFVIALTNNSGSSLAGLADVVVDIKAGPENATAATKSFTASLAILALLAVYIGRLHKVSPAAGQVMVQELRFLPDKISKALRMEEEIKELAAIVSAKPSLIFLGRKYCFPLAQEAAHKFKETTYIHAEGISSAEFMHGPNALVQKGYPIIFIIPLDSQYDENIKVLKKLKKQGADIIAVTTKGNKKLRNSVQQVFYIHPAAEAVVPIIAIAPIQLLAYFTALAKGIDVDSPRNITKYVE